MRILMIGHYPPHWGGIANHLDNLVRELRERHEVHVLTYGPIEPRDFERDLVHQVSVPNVFGIRGTSFSILASRKIVRLHRKFRFDVLHAHFVGTTSYAGLLAKKRTGVPLVVTAHGSDLDFMSKLPLGRYFVKKSLMEADAVIAVSHYLAKKAISLGAQRVHVVPNGIKPMNLYRLERGYITFIGALRKYKNPEVMIELAGAFPGERFLVVGDGPLRAALEAAAPPNVTFLGYRRDIDRILSRTKVLILPSKREGFGLVVIEAGSLGVPVLGSRAGGIPELVRDGKNGMLFETFDELVSSLELLLERKSARKMGHLGREISGGYRWPEIAHRIEEIYLKLHSRP
ncbi:glycosyltransferase family 4 protein [Thermococcus atlanticus]